MAQLNQILKTNPYSNIIIELIAYLNSSNISPHEKMAAAHLLRLRSIYWGTDINIDARLGGDSMLKQCPACYAKNIEMGATSDRSYNPYTSFIENFRQKLNSMNMNAANAWIYWMQVVDVFYDNVDFLDYFMYTYKNGEYADFYLNEVLGISSRKGTYKNGVKITLEREGTGLISQVFSIDFNNIYIPDLTGRYFILYKETTPYMFWFRNGSDDDLPTVVLSDEAVTTSIEISGLTLKNEIQDITVDAIITVLDIGGSTIWEVNSTSGLITRIQDIGPTVNTELIVGTANIGVSEAETIIYGYDGSELSTGNTTMTDYVNNWNLLKVPYDSALGITTPYLKNTNASNLTEVGLLMSTTIPSNTLQLTFNTPGNTYNFQGGDGILKQCLACAW